MTMMTANLTTGHDDCRDDHINIDLLAKPWLNWVYEYELDITREQG